MCLVSYIPTKSGYILSSNRDESPKRDAKLIGKEAIGKELIIFPIDTKGGSWIIASYSHRVVCLLNGAFQNHISRPPYSKSRGMMMKSFFEYSSAEDFFEHYDLWMIEPFTMILAETSRLYEYRWDGSVKHIKSLDQEKTHMWSSCTLYTENAQEKRAQSLKSMLSGIDLSDIESVKEAHILIDRDDLYNGLYMDRDGIIQTISHTQVIHSGSSLNMRYYNLISKSLEETSI